MGLPWESSSAGCSDGVAHGMGLNPVDVTCDVYWDLRYACDIMCHVETPGRTLWKPVRIVVAYS